MSYPALVMCLPVRYTLMCSLKCGCHWTRSAWRRTWSACARRASTAWPSCFSTPICTSLRFLTSSPLLLCSIVLCSHMSIRLARSSYECSHMSIRLARMQVFGARGARGGTRARGRLRARIAFLAHYAHVPSSPSRLHRCALQSRLYKYLFISIQFFID